MYIIYCIKNKINDKRYIGRSEKPFEERYYKGAWWRYSDNGYLRASAKKYGAKNFEVSILEINNTLEENIEREIFYIKSLNSLTPNGYNLTDKRFEPGKRTDGMFNNNTLYIYTFLNVETNEIFSSDHFPSISIKINYSKSWLQKSCKIQGKFFGKWKLLEITRKNNEWKQKYILYNIKTKKWIYDNRVVIVDKLRKLGEMDNHIFLVLDEKRKICKNWCLYKNRNSLKPKKKKGTVEYEFICPDGILRKIKDLPNFCRENDLRYDCIFKVITKSRDQYLGYRLPNVTPRIKEIKSIEILDLYLNKTVVNNIEELALYMKCSTAIIYRNIKKNKFLYKNYRFIINYKYNYNIDSDSTNNNKSLIGV